MWCGRHSREGEGSKAEMVWTFNKRRLKKRWMDSQDFFEINLAVLPAR